MAICAKCGEFMLPSCKNCGSDLIEKDVIRKIIKQFRDKKCRVLSTAVIADLLEKEIEP